MSAGEIAIIGMAGRFPGASNVATFWRNLRDGVESIRSLSDEELLAAGVSAAELADPDYVKAAPVLEGIDLFDAGFFGFSPRDASVMDPAHRLFLEVVWEAMEHAGITAFPEDGAVGVFAGSGAPYYLMDHVRRNPTLMRSMGEFLVRHTNNDMNFLATRVSYEMDLRGPSVNIQTACSSALVSVHMACESIRRGECTVAFAGGSTVLVPDRQGYKYHEGEIMSPDGHCRPFDAKSSGTVFGSGSGCVVLKRLDEALDHGDTIHAVIKGSAINNDGAMRVGFLAPGVDGQAAVVGLALDAAGVSAESITYIETHGTGTSVGDPIEVMALNQAFRIHTERRQYCAIGSVKSNIGHLGEAGGVASLIKAIMALKHRQLPPSLGYESPNPQIDFDDSPFFVNDRLRPWEAEGRLRCGVTALGAGGTNCHVVLEEAPPPLDGEGARPAQLIVLSARTTDALDRLRDDLATVLEDDAALDLADVAWTLSAGRRPMQQRLAFVARDTEAAVDALRDRTAKHVTTQRADGSPKSIVFMFPGGGAQYARMGIEFYEHDEAYRIAMDACLVIVNPRLRTDLGAILFCADANTEQAGKVLEQPSLTLPALFSTEYALARMFMSWGVEPSAFLGHSMGEYVAACLSGVMTLDEALQMVMLRGRLFEATPRGGMLSVPMSAAELRALMPQGLDIAAANAPELCVASGPEALIETLEATLAAREVVGTRVRIDVAAHSSMLEPVLEEFRRFCRTVNLQPPRLPFLSNVSGRWIDAAEATDPEYWVRHLRSTVRFADCFETLCTNESRVLIEMGPGRTLSSLARAQREPAKHAFNAMRHPDEPTSDLDHALMTVGKIWLSGAGLDWTALYHGQLRNRVPLPTYSWDHARHWIDAPKALAADAATVIGAADGSRRERVEDWFERSSWRQAPPAPPLTTANERVLVFADAGGFGDAIADRLADAGRRVTRVREGTQFAQLGDHFSLRAGVVEDYKRLMKSLAADGGLPARVVHTWGVTENGMTAALDTTLESGFHSMLGFAQALSVENPDSRLTLNVVTSNLQRIGGEERLEPFKSLVLGPARVMPQELPHVRSRAIDVVLPADRARRAAVAALVAAEAASEPRDETVAYRGRDRFVQSLEPVKLESFGTRLRMGGVYLITGGLGGLGFTLAKHLAKTRKACLVLLGRGAVASRLQARIAELEALGAAVEVVQADVTNVPQMTAAVARALNRFGALHGVFHAAGTLGDSLMPLKTRADAERVLAPKVQGTLGIDAALGGAPLEVFVLFSSISSIAGLAGQADYTAANAFLDAFAQERTARTGDFTVAVNWSAWRGVGMAANIAAGAGGGSGINEEVHPVLGHRIWSSPGTELFASQVAIGAHWVVAEHRIRNGWSLMPGTGFIELARAALEARPQPRAVEIRDLAFMSPFILPEDAPRELRLHLAHNGGARQALVFAGRTHGKDGSAYWQEHVTATVGYVDVASPGALDIAAISGRCTLREETFSPDQQSVNMDFGKRWQNLRSIRYGGGEALVTLALAPEFVGELETYRLHPALLDMATGRCEALIESFDPANDFYVPLSYSMVRMHAPLTAHLHAHVRVAPNDFDPREQIVFDVTITDESGRVLVEVEEFVMTRLIDTAQLLGGGGRAGKLRAHASFELPVAAATLPVMAQQMQSAIEPEEGMEALERIIAGPAFAQIFATPRPVAALLGEMRHPSTSAAAARSPSAAIPLVRVEEAEVALAEHDSVQECVVLRRVNRPGEFKLVAYIVHAAGNHATVSDLRRFVKKHVAEQFVPSTYVDLSAVPRMASGEIELSALPDPFRVVDDHVAPGTPTESLIADIWQELLGVERVGRHDDFFELGGHSLIAIRLMARLRSVTGIEQPLSMLFERPRLSDFAALYLNPSGEVPLVASLKVPDVTAAVELSASGETGTPASYVQRSMWAAAQRYRSAPLNIITLPLRLQGPLHIKALEGAIQDLFFRHPTLRARLFLSSGRLIQAVEPSEAVAIDVEEVAGGSLEQRRQQAIVTLYEEGRRVIDLTSGPTTKVRLLRLAAAEHILCFFVHHAMCDGWSTRIMIRDLTALYSSHALGKIADLPPIKEQYSDFSDWQVRTYESGGFVDDIRYWQKELTDFPSPIALQAIALRKMNRDWSAKLLRLTTINTVRGELNDIAHRNGMSTFVLLLSVLGVLIHQRTSATDLVIGVSTLNRWRSDSFEFVGCATNLLPVRLQLTKAISFIDICKHANNKIHGLLAHGRTPWELILREVKGSVLPGSVSPIWCQLLESASTTVIPEIGLTISPFAVERSSAFNELDIDFFESSDDLSGDFTYRSSLFDKDMISTLLIDYYSILRLVLDNPTMPIEELRQKIPSPGSPLEK